MLRHPRENRPLSRRAILKGLCLSSLMLRAPFLRSSPLPGWAGSIGLLDEADRDAGDGFPFADLRMTPHYPAKSPLEDILHLAAPGTDEYVTEKYANEIQTILNAWGASLKASVTGVSALEPSLAASLQAWSLVPLRSTQLRSDATIEAFRRQFRPGLVAGPGPFLQSLKSWLGPIARVHTAEFEITGVTELQASPIRLRIDIRYDLVATRPNGDREERVGSWKTEWQSDSGHWLAARWEAGEEMLSVLHGPGFVDVTQQALGATDSYRKQLRHGSDHWRTVLDGACGIDVYGNNGVTAGDYDNDGFDDLYICQPAGLPNRLYRNRGDGTFEDVTERAGVAVLDNTSCALFADFLNRGRQDLLVVCSSGPLLFQNQGDGTFALKKDAFKFARPPEGSFTHAALADYDRDGRLDIYFCLYSYYLGLDQYHYPVPYYDARNGPPNFLFQNQGDGTFIDKTEAAGLNAENDRYSFACAWGEAGKSGGYPDLYVANDFGRNNLYRNNGNGTFSAVSVRAHVQDVGAGMSACWADVENDGRQDIYVSNMWSAAGQRVSEQERFHQASTPEVLDLYRRHARGNALYSNLGDGTFSNATARAGVELGRWAWSSDFWDFDHDGYADLYITNGYITAPEEESSARERFDLGSFFWRQVVAKSPDDPTPNPAYERGWQALNEMVRSDRSWSGRERNVMYANNRDGTFTEVSGAVGLDFLEDSRSFALADIDRDGRLEVVLKNRNGPQLRILQNRMNHLGGSISFRLRGTKSNRDAIGAAITLEAGSLRQTKYLQAGSGFLAQHAKEIFFGVGNSRSGLRATIQWPSGASQVLENLPVDHRVSVEEGSSAFEAKPFGATPYKDGQSSLEAEVSPASIETWLIQPFKAPDFSLRDKSGKVHSLQLYKGSFVLLTFYSEEASPSLDQLTRLGREAKELEAASIKIVGLNVGPPQPSSDRWPFTTLQTNDDVAGIYNILYRYLYDRRRNLGIPTSFLLDRDGTIVKVYQGALAASRLFEDVGAIPASQSGRMGKALPFPGLIYKEAFQRNAFTYGVAMFQHGYLDQAAESFQQVIAADPGNAEGFYNLGTLNLRRNNYTDARKYLEQTLKLRPNYPEAWNNIGMMAAQQGDAAKAIQAFQKSLALRPGYAVAMLNLGNVYRRQGDIEGAKQALSQALALQPDDPETNYSLGMFYAQQNQLDQASEYLLKAVDLRPGYPEAMNNLGVIYVRRQNYEKAEELFKSCLEETPSFDRSYLNLAQLYALEGDKGKALQVLRDLLRLQPQNEHAQKAIEALHASQ